MRILLIDDLRSFADGRPAAVARTSAEGVALLRGEPLDELWLDHDLGGDDTIWPVIQVLEEAAFGGTPYPVTTIFVHSANAPGAARIVRVLERWGYHVRGVPGSSEVVYPDGNSSSVGRD